MTHVRSQNGWPVIHAAEVTDKTQVWTIPGHRRDVRVRLLPGPLGFTLAHWCLWFDRFVEDLEQGEDDWGWAERPVTGSDADMSNHASATAVDLNALRHPYGRTGTFTEDQRGLMLDTLASKYRGVIRAGFTYRTRSDDMHFEYVAGRLLVRETAASLFNTPFGDQLRDANPWLRWNPNR